MTNPENPTRTVAPAVDLFENSAEFLIVADVPGVKEDAVDIEFDRGELRLVANRAAGAGNDLPALQYRRSFRISDDVDQEKISAALDAGVLKITLPKAAELQPKKIQVKVA